MESQTFKDIQKQIIDQLKDLRDISVTNILNVDLITSK
jgi:hypothetical protein